MITLASIFRNSASYVERYFSQVNRLREHIPVRLLLAEGDSTDGTYLGLQTHLEPGDVLRKIDHGGPVYPSQDIPERWRQIATVVRGLVDRYAGEELVWVESDLQWWPETILGLVKDLDAVSAVAPMVLYKDTSRFYDVWGFRKDGVKFEPYSPHYPYQPPGLVKIDSCGSCFAIKGTFEWDGMWPFTAGGNLWLDPALEVRHP